LGVAVSALVPRDHGHLSRFFCSNSSEEFSLYFSFPRSFSWLDPRDIGKIHPPPPRRIGIHDPNFCSLSFEAVIEHCEPVALGQFIQVIGYGEACLTRTIKGAGSSGTGKSLGFNTASQAARV
jgi:hypothetical protein